MQHDYNGFPGQRVATKVARQHPDNTQLIQHGEHTLLLPVFDKKDGICLEPSASTLEVPRDELVIRDIGTPWDVSGYGKARKPVSLGMIDADARAAFVRPLPAWCQHVLDMPIKFPGTDIRVLGALASLIPTIQRIVDAEAQLNPQYANYFAYLSVHQAELEPGERMRENPYHVDGFQGPRWSVKHPVNHSYLLCDQLPTVFYPMEFPLDDIDLNFDDIYAEFGRIIEGAEQAPEWRAQDFELIFMDAYCVHRGDVARRPMTRTWLRISWETRIFDRLGNSHNPLFDYNWDMVARDTDPRIRPRVIAAHAAA